MPGLLIEATFYAIHASLLIPLIGRYVVLCAVLLLFIRAQPRPAPR